MAGTTRVTVTLKFLYGPVARFSFHVASSIVSPTNGVILGMITVLEAITRGKCVHIEISLQAAFVGSAGSGVAYVSEDKAFMRFKDDIGIGHNYRVMGLKAAILLTNGEDVDATATGVPAFIAAMNTYAKGRGGNDIATFIKGYRKENRKLLKGGRI